MNNLDNSNKMVDAVFEEIEAEEFNGAARDFILGAAAGATITAAILT